MADFRDWRERFEDFTAVTRLREDPIATQRGILRSALHEEWTKMWSEGTITIAEDATLGAMLDALHNYLRRHRHVLLDRKVFLDRSQQAGESVDQYCTVLRQLDRSSAYEHTCNDRAQHQDERLRDRLVTGLEKSNMRQEVLKTPLEELTLERTLEICRNYESSSATDSGLSSKGINKVQSTYKKGKQGSSDKNKENNKGQDKDSSKKYDCKACTRNHGKDQCRAKDMECFGCGKKGHVVSSPFCKAKKTKGTNSIQLLDIKVGNLVAEEDKIKLEMRHGHRVAKDVSWLPDTGAFADAMGPEHLYRMKGKGKVKLCKETENLVGPEGRALDSMGTVKVELNNKDLRYSTTVHVVRNVTTPLLSKQGCKALGLIPGDWPRTTVAALSVGKAADKRQLTETGSGNLKNGDRTRKELIEEFPEVFKEDGQLKEMVGPPMVIELEPHAQPRRTYKAYSIPLHWQEKVKTQLEKMEEKGVIEDVPANEVPEWSHPMVVVPKKNSDEPRITVDFTALNKFVKRPGYQTKIPREEVLAIPQGMGVFTTLDARHGYWQVPLADESKHLTTFVTPWGSKRFCRNAIGLISADMNTTGGEMKRWKGSRTSRRWSRT